MKESDEKINLPTEGCRAELLSPVSHLWKGMKMLARGDYKGLKTQMKVWWTMSGNIIN